MRDDRSSTYTSKLLRQIDEELYTQSEKYKREVFYRDDLYSVYNTAREGRICKRTLTEIFIEILYRKSLSV